MSAHIRR